MLVGEGRSGFAKIVLVVAFLATPPALDAKATGQLSATVAVGGVLLELLRKMKHGLTLTSLMVAVALSGVLAVAGTRLVVNQMNTLRVMELRDKGDSIFEFYSNLLHDDKVWWCTLYDNVLGQNPTPINNPNFHLRRCVLRAENCATSGTAMSLMGPDCRFLEPLERTGTIQHRFDAFGEWWFRPKGTLTKETYANSQVTLIPVGGKDLKDSVTQAASDGWWNVKVTWEHKGASAVDIIFTQTFDKDKWRNASVGKRYLPELKRERKLKVRRSANQVSQSYPTDWHKYAVTSIALHTANRQVNRHTTKTVLTSHTAGHMSECHQDSQHYQNINGGVVQSNTSCTRERGRVAVTPTDTYQDTRCASQRSVIAQIGVGTGTTAAKNVRCALGGSGKMVRYGTCPGSYHRDSCAVNGQTFYSPSRWYSQWVSETAVAHVNRTGNLQCVGLSSWPATRQGERGPKGRDGGGPRGPRGYAYSDSRCACRTTNCTR